MLSAMDAVDPPRGHGWWLRGAAVLGLLLVAAVLLPVSAFVVEAVSDRAENWILPLQVVLMALLGAGVGVVLHRVGPRATAVTRAVLVWGAVGLLAAAMTDAAWWALLAG